MARQAAEGSAIGEPAPVMGIPAAPPHTALLRVLLVAAITSSALHYTHNFLGPSPDISPFFFATIFTDFLTGTAMLAFGVATLSGSRRRPSPR